LFCVSTSAACICSRACLDWTGIHAWDSVEREIVALLAVRGSVCL
jgi:hypothetical protein